ncbi:MAG: SURF1 family protein [Parvularcula sp.]
MNPLRRPVLSGVSLIALIILLNLGMWQVRRLHWKTDLIAQTEARLAAAPVLVNQFSDDAPDYMTVRVRGSFEEGPPAFISGMYESVPGWFEFRLFRLASGPLVILNRGFVSQDEYAAGKMTEPPKGDTEVSAIVRHFPQPKGLAHLFMAPANPERGEFYTREKDVLASFLLPEGQPAAIADVYLEAWPRVEGAMPPLGGTTRVEFSNRHFGYILTWYGLAAGLVGVYIALMRQSSRNQDDA